MRCLKRTAHYLFNVVLLVLLGTFGALFPPVDGGQGTPQKADRSNTIETKP